MNGDYLLDSNIVIDIFRGHVETIARVRKINLVYVPVIVLGELYFGANKSLNYLAAYWKTKFRIW